MKRKIFALGFFDGVHLGHQALLRACVEMARRENGSPAAITFDNHPKTLAMADPPSLISTVRDRKLLLERFGMESVLVLPVTPEVTHTPWEQFLELLLQENAAGFVCGDDFRFGYRGQGTSEKLRQFCQERGLPCVVVPQQELGDIRISSTHIRRQIEEGSMAEAVRFLGHPYTLTGRVLREGRTAVRLRFPKGLVIPRLGIYACTALAEGILHPAVTYVARRQEETSVELWLPDHTGPLPEEITVEFHRFLRPEEQFPSKDALWQELSRNADAARQLIRS